MAQIAGSRRKRIMGNILVIGDKEWPIWRLALPGRSREMGLEEQK
jgi:hypothetical protein